MADKLQPRLRFAGFTDAWTQRKLGDVAGIMGGNAWKSGDYSEDGEFLVITIANVNGNQYVDDSFGNRLSTDAPGRYRLHEDDLLISLTGNVGRVSRMTGVPAVLNQRVGKLTPNVDDAFVFARLRSPEFLDAMITAGQGAAQSNISNDDVLGYTFFAPAHCDEQTGIGEFFRLLDALIAANQRKADLLARLKRAYLQRLLPEPGSMTPRLRFSGLDEEWSERSLGDVLQYEQPTNYIVASTDYDDSYRIPVLTAGKSFVLGYTNEDIGVKRASEDSPVIIFDDFTTSSNYVDFPFKVKSSAMKILSLKDDDDDLRFVYHVLRSVDFVPGAHERHWISEFAGFRVLVPSHAEQRAIGKLLRALDALIAANQTKLTQLQTLKRAYLQKMFV